MDKALIKQNYKLNDGQLAKFEDLTNYIIMKCDLYRSVKRENPDSGVLQCIINGLDYNIYKMPKSLFYDLWSGCISERAIIEILRADAEGRKARITGEHFWNRKRVIYELLEGTWCDILRRDGVQGLLDLYYTKPGIGLFHITTVSENINLSKKEQNDISVSPQEQYRRAGIVLHRADDHTFLSKGQRFWQSPDMDEIIELADYHNVLQYELEYA